MLRTNIQKKDTPIYREVVKQAFHAAWHDRHLWPLAFVTSFIFSAGIYDILWKGFNTISTQDSSLLVEKGQIITSIGSGFVLAMQRTGGFLNIIFGLQLVLILAILFVAALAFACICQGGLVFALGARRRGEPSGLALSLRIGGKAFWSVAALNAISLSCLWILRFLILIPMTINLSSGENAHWVLYLLSFILFSGLQIIITIVQIFALNALILQGATAAQALARGYELFKRHWIIAIETAFLQALIAGISIIAFAGFVFVTIIPIVMAIITSIGLNSAGLYYSATSIGFFFMFLSFCTGIAFLTHFQYATWTYLYRRIGEGGAVAKLHRIYRQLTGRYSFEK
ncbi:hypothetical protein IT408_00545 [Candidatus Uhrbacteria bacterium]|nr:hypothetical protein [Candidatus Uhrbacteria bacterium]